jgi:hypothetical protein
MPYSTPARTRNPDELGAMTEIQHKEFENRLRCAAQRQGLKLVKYRRRDPRAIGYGTYTLVDPCADTVQAGGTDGTSGLGLDGVARRLWGDG